MQDGELVFLVFTVRIGERIVLLLPGGQSVSAIDVTEYPDTLFGHITSRAQPSLTPLPDGTLLLVGSTHDSSEGRNIGNAGAIVFVP